jgi:hypothetical protein
MVGISLPIILFIFNATYAAVQDDSYHLPLHHLFKLRFKIYLQHYRYKICGKTFVINQAFLVNPQF